MYPYIYKPRKVYKDTRHMHILMYAHNSYTVKGVPTHIDLTVTYINKKTFMYIRCTKISLLVLDLAIVVMLLCCYLGITKNQKKMMINRR